ncbi:Rid family detoxifying hydrolase [Blattabacterium cuenoti]|uniref:Rid family detoxifying hydrolase n=1 Tax=Blattabacterium cuenoti TaxID=1653831 RepID=UPI00163C9C2B|nr:Rid family detoxifying hydrolase [Blattabacterium cuenoti]
MNFKKNSISKDIPIHGPYSSYVLIKNFLFISGQIGINIKSGKLISSSIEKETTQIMYNIKIILLKNRMDFDNIVKSTIFLKKMDDFDKVNKVYSEFFSRKKQYPARETVQVSGLPKKANIEISMIGYHHN